MGRRKANIIKYALIWLKSEGPLRSIVIFSSKTPRPEDNDSSDSITEPPPAKRILRSQVDAFDKNKCALCQRDKKCLRRTKEQDPENL